MLNKPAQGFAVVPRRWVIERSFAWLGRDRRLARDFARRLEVSTAMVVRAIILPHPPSGKPLTFMPNLPDRL